LNGCYNDPNSFCHSSNRTTSFGSTDGFIRRKLSSNSAIVTAKSNAVTGAVAVDDDETLIDVEDNDDDDDDSAVGTGNGSCNALICVGVRSATNRRNGNMAASRHNNFKSAPEKLAVNDANTSNDTELLPRNIYSQHSQQYKNDQRGRKEWLVANGATYQV
jgi:hypothetical protein